VKIELRCWAVPYIPQPVVSLRPPCSRYSSRVAFVLASRIAFEYHMAGNHPGDVRAGGIVSRHKSSKQQDY
jgi:hypothetical protein